MRRSRDFADPPPKAVDRRNRDWYLGGDVIPGINAWATEKKMKPESFLRPIPSVGERGGKHSGKSLRLALRPYFLGAGARRWITLSFFSSMGMGMPFIPTRTWYSRDVSSGVCQE